jgi:serine/threonine protein phosphatase 1
MENIFVFGDIHGCYKSLEKGINLALEYNARCVFLGDYVDRGPDSIRTLEILIEEKLKHPNWVFLRGNHDQMLIDLIEKKVEPNSEGFVLGEYGFSYERTTETYFKFLAEGTSFQDMALKFLKSTTLYHETENYIFVHAPLRDSNTKLEQKSMDELIWNYSLEPKWQNKKFIHGHATVEYPTFIDKGININTQCGYENGYLTALLIPYENQGNLSFFKI